MPTVFRLRPEKSAPELPTNSLTIQQPLGYALPERRSAVDWSFTYAPRKPKKNLIPLATLLAMDERCQSEFGIREALGDRYLCCNNSVYLGIRKRFLSFGFRYVGDATDPLWRGYLTASLMSLPDLLEQRAVPFCNNSEGARRVLNRNPAWTLSNGGMHGLFRQNYLLHESCHCIADDVVKARVSLPSGRWNENEISVVRALVCESFANLVERIAGAMATTQAHALFFALNSYVSHGHRDRNLQCTISEFPMECIFKLGILAYFYVNAHSRPANAKTAEMFIDMAFSPDTSLSPVERRLLLSLVENTFLLETGFTEGTSSDYFRFMGLERAFETICGARMNRENVESFGLPDLLTPLAEAALSSPVGSSAAA
jgi:hypothetical protein